MRIAIAGIGYVGLVTAVCLAHHGHNVTCVDIEENKIKQLQDGKSPIYELDLEDLMQQNKARLTYTTDYVSAYKDADVIFISVGTPEKIDGSANLNFVYDAAKQIAQSVEKNCVVVVKSTVPIGTNDRIEAILEQEKVHTVTIEVASNPEFLSQGKAVHDTLHASRIVLGIESEHAERILREIYADFDAPILVTNRRSAEMIKYASNDFLALKISYINEIANLCELVGADIQDVAKGMGLDPRIGDKFLNAGIGYGGSCFPKDTKALHWLASTHDYEIKTIKAAIEVNEQQKLKLLKKSKKYYESLNGLTVAVLGLTFKPDTDDIREAPSLVNIPVMLEEGATVHAWDAAGVSKFKAFMKKNTDCNLDKLLYFDTPEQAVNGADICFIFTEWPEVKAMRGADFLNMKHPIVLDGRNCLVIDVEEAGILYESIGSLPSCVEKR